MTRQHITSRNDKLLFGKHKGHTVAEVLDNDWEYILWLYENDVASFPQDIIDDAYTNDANSSPPEDYYWQPD